jgi:hypothetical protein
VKLEDRVLEAIIAISEGKSRDDAIDKLYSQILLLHDDLRNDNDALDWFNLSTAPFAIPSASSTGALPYLNNKFLGQSMNIKY